MNNEECANFLMNSPSLVEYEKLVINKKFFKNKLYLNCILSIIQTIQIAHKYSLALSDLNLKQSVYSVYETHV